VLFDAIGILVGIGFGTRFLLFFAGTEGLASIRMQTELSLAHGIQATLVPTISYQNASFERLPDRMRRPVSSGMR
jgi:hypothetical protein